MEIFHPTSRKPWTCIKRQVLRHMDEGWVAVIAGAAVSEAEMRAVVVGGTGADVEEPAPAAISPLPARPNHAFRGGQMDCQRANRPLWPTIQTCVGINGAVQCTREQESL